MENKIIDEIIKGLDDVGVTVPVITENDDIQFSNLQMDSTHWISLIIYLEDFFNLSIPDEYLIHGRISGIRDLEAIIKEVMEQ